MADEGERHCRLNSKAETTVGTKLTKVSGGGPFGLDKKGAADDLSLLVAPTPTFGSKTPFTDRIEAAVQCSPLMPTPPSSPLTPSTAATAAVAHGTSASYGGNTFYCRPTLPQPRTCTLIESSTGKGLLLPSWAHPPADPDTPRDLENPCGIAIEVTYFCVSCV